MSLGGRATKGGANKGGTNKAANKHAQEKPKTTEKPQPKEKIKPQATTEQIRMAQMMDRKTADPSEVRKMVLQLMEMTCKSEEEVCCALHDTDNDMSAACYLLLDDSQTIQSEWVTNEKKKKKPPVAANNGEIEPPREARGSRGGQRPRRGETDGGRGRGGRGRGGRGGRGRRGGRGDFNVTTDISPQPADSFPPAEDWENEEWSGSLSDTKVFTPTVKPQILPDDSPHSINTTEDWDAIPENNNGDHIPSYTYHNTNHVPQATPPRLEPQQISPVPGLSNLTPKETTSSLESYVTSHQHQVNNPMGMSGSLSAAQSQYLSQLTQQTQRHASSISDSVYTSNYGVYGSSEITTQRKQRARIPPPSKIPMSAVEMPAGVENTFLDVTFGEPEPAHTTPVVSESLPPVAPVLDTPAEPAYTNPTSQQLPSEPLSSVPVSVSAPAVSRATPDLPHAHTHAHTHTAAHGHAHAHAAPHAHAAHATHTPLATLAAHTTHTTATTPSLESQLSATMKQLSVGVAESAPHYARHKQPHYAPHHTPVYNANVYAPQVNSTNSSLTGVPSAMTGSYPTAVTLSQYQQPINYQLNQTSSSASVYGGSALYTAAPYNTYQQHHQQQQQQHHTSVSTKEPTQYDSPVVSSNSLTSVTTSHTSHTPHTAHSTHTAHTTHSAHTTTPKVTTTTASSAVSGVTGVSGVSASSGVSGVSGVSGTYVPQQPQYYGYDEQIMRHHMSGGYYEVGYGRDGFGLSGERFPRTENASPQQVAVPAVPAVPTVPGYAYYYQPPPNTYQYGVYPQYGSGAGNVSAAAAKVSSYQPPAPYDAQDNYTKPGPYSGSGSKTAAPATDLTSAMYAKAHVAINKVNSYDKASFHSGTPPPFSAGHVYIPSHHALHHQMDMRLSNSHSRRESAASSRATNKPATNKQYNAQSYWSN